MHALWYPSAIKEPIPDYCYGGRMLGYFGAVLHTNQSDGADLYSWVSNPSHEVSCHFQFAKDGRVFQYIPLDRQSWCQSDGNSYYISCETEGFNTEYLTDAQAVALANVYCFLHDEYGIPYALADLVGQRGFGWHGMGGKSWGGHPYCPGEPKKSQRQYILDLAQSTNNGENDMTPEQAAQLQFVYDQIHGAVGHGQKDFASTIAAVLGTSQHDVNVDNSETVGLQAIADAVRAIKGSS